MEQTMTISPERDGRAALLRECRTLMAGRIRRSIGALMRQANDVLSDMAFRESRNVVDSPYFDAIREIQLRRRELELRFENRFAALFEDTLNRSLQQRGRRNSEVSGTMDATPAEDRLDTRSISRVRNDCRATLLALDRRVSLLLDIDEMYPSLNPMRPELIYEAFRSVCADIHSGTDVQSVLLDLFDRCVAVRLESVYSEVNTLLARGPVDTDLAAESGTDDGSGRMVLVEGWVTVAMQRHLEGWTLPEFVREFIDRHWRILLQRIYLKSGDSGPDWDRAVQTMDELVLSVQDLEAPDECRRVAWLLPGLVYRLKSGMRTISMPVPDQRAFLHALRNHHVRIAGRRLTGPDRTN